MFKAVDWPTAEHAFSAVGQSLASRVGPASCVASWRRSRPRLAALNVAGNRESVAPGIGARVGAFLAEVFKRLGDRDGD